jgi:FAD/FMN-containing dehydrogenase
MASLPAVADWIAPDQQAFEAHRRQWNGMIDRRPSHIARCKTSPEVSEALRWAKKSGKAVTVRGGGHGVSGAAVADEALLIDLSGLNDVSVDPQSEIASVGGGALLGDLDRATQAHGLAVTAGVEPETGVGGLTLGGGIGFLARKLGLTIDNMIGADVVLADGSRLQVDDASEPDLFWALRGGGGGTAIVTQFEFRLHRVGPRIAQLQAFFPWQEAAQVFSGYRDYLRSAPDEVGAYALFVRIPDADPFPQEHRGKSAVAIVAMHCGPDVDEGKQALRPLSQLGSSFLLVDDATDYLTFQTSFAGAAPRGERYYWKSHFLHDLDEDAISTMARWASELPGLFSNVFIEAMGGAIGRVRSDATAFPHREARFNLGISTGWSDPAQDHEMISRTRELFEALRPFSTGGVYSNYMDFDESDRATGAFGANHARLVEIRRRYDPDGRLHRIA